jgi:C-terminal processing protease CtpA/Prc
MAASHRIAVFVFALCAGHTAIAAPPVDQATRTEVVETLAERMAQHYVSADLGARTAAILRQRLNGGAYDGESDAAAFAVRLTADLQELTRDKHAEVAYMEQPEPPDRPQNQLVHPGAIDIDVRVRGMERMMRAVGKRRFGFPDSRRLAGNVAYVRIDEFPEPILAGQAIAAEMSAVDDAAALILDLRENGGGNPDSVTQLCAWLFDDRPVHLNDQLTRGIGRVLPVWTQPVANDLRFGSRKPVFILVGKETFSAAENLAYTLQALKRATIVGVPTGGGAHGGRGFRLSAHFIGGIPNRRTINAVTGADWEGKGVQPDVRVDEAQALETAQALAAKAIAAAKK